MLLNLPINKKPNQILIIVNTEYWILQQFPIGAPLEPSPYLQAFLRYLAPIYRGHDLDLSRSRDAIGDVTIWW